MDTSAKKSDAKGTLRTVLPCFAMYIVFVALTAGWMRGTEGSGSVYPLGAETVMTGLTPGAGQTMFAEFNITYNANSLLNGQSNT